MADTTYNGWTNYATWLINLELCDDIIESMDRSERREYVGEPAQFGDFLKDQCEEIVTDFGQLETTMPAVNYALAFLGTVNWWEIAKTHMEDWTSDDTDDDEEEEVA